MPPTQAPSAARKSAADYPRVRRAERLLVAVAGAAALALTWPIFPLVSHYRPTILGLPFSFAWVIFWLLAVFAALCYAFRCRHPPGADEES